MKKRLLSIALAFAMLAALSVGAGAAYTEKTLENGSWSVSGTAIDAARLGVAEWTVEDIAAEALAEDGKGIAKLVAPVADDLIAMAELDFEEGGKTPDSTVTVSFSGLEAGWYTLFVESSLGGGKVVSRYFEDGAVSTAVSDFHCVAVIKGGYYLSDLLTEETVLVAITPLADVSQFETEGFEYINLVAASGIITPDAEGNFRPDEAITREAAATAIYRLLGGESAELVDAGYADVAAHRWYSDAVDWNAMNEIMVGFTGADGEKLFGVGDSLTNEQLAVLLYKTFGELMPAAELTEEETAAFMAAYSDSAEISDWAVDALLWIAGLEGAEILTEVSEDGEPIIAPQGEVTRGEFAQIAGMFLVMGTTAE